jgi:hypothetical protein
MAIEDHHPSPSPSSTNDDDFLLLFLSSSFSMASPSHPSPQPAAFPPSSSSLADANSSLLAEHFPLIIEHQQQQCIEVSEAIRAQGVDDLASWAFVQCAIAVVYSCLFILGLLGNGSVLLAFAQNKR